MLLPASQKITRLFSERNREWRVQSSMKWLISSFLIVISLAGMAQAGGQDQRASLLNAYQTTVTATGSSAAVQAGNWQLEKERNPKNVLAWLNYYLWTDRNKELPAGQKKELLAQTLKDAGKHIKGTAAWHILNYLQSGKKDSASLLKALTTAESNYWVYPYAVQYAVMKQNETALKEYTGKLNAIAPLSPGLYEYHYNVLMSANSGATIYAQGLNDLVPLAVLQQAYGFRRDVRLRYYDGGIREKENAYLCLSSGREIISQYPLAAYTGLLVKIEGSDINEMKEHMEKNFTLVYLNQSNYLSGELSQLYKNYLPSFLLLYQQYKATGNEAGGAAIKTLILKIAGQAGITEEVLKQLNR
jgi:hypothetical protein